MNRIQKKFSDLKRKKKKALIVYITAGDPSIAATYKFAAEFDKSKVDILELGVPFSDPIADGPTIQAASLRALKNRVNLNKIFVLVKKIREKSEIPIVLMTYYNPVYRYGIKNFTEAAKKCGVDGVIVPDLPPEEANDLIKQSKKRDLKHIFLLSPTSSYERMKLVSKKSSGFIYYVSLTGVTGARRKLPPEITDKVKKIKRLTKKPVCVGFGISTPKQAGAIAKIADGVIVGSAIIKMIEKNIKHKNLVEKTGKFVNTLAGSIK